MHQNPPAPTPWKAVIDEMVSSRAHGDGVVSYWKSKTAGMQYTPAEVVAYLEERRLWHFDHLISHVILESSQIDQQYDLISRVSGVWGPKGFMRIWDALAEAARANPEAATTLLDRLLVENPPGATHATSALLLGIALSEREPTLAVIRDAIRSNVAQGRVAGLCALSDLIRKTKSLSNPTVAIVEALPDPTDDLEARIQLDILERVAALGGPPVGAKILKIARNGTTGVRLEAATIATQHFGSDEAFLRELFEIVSSDPEALRGYWAGKFLGLVYALDPEAVLLAIGGVSEQTSLVDSFYDGADEFLAAVGTSNRERFFEAVGEWLDRRSARLLIQAPALLVRAFKDNEGDLLRLLEGWELGETPQFLVRLEAMKELLSSPSIEANRAFASILAAVDALAKRGGVNEKLALRGETDPRFRALRLIDALLNPPPPLNHAQVKQAMSLVPSFVRFVKMPLFLKELAKKVSDHPLIRMLDIDVPSAAEIEAALKALAKETEPNKRLGAWARARQLVKMSNHLSYWEKVFGGLREGEKGMPSLGDKLRNPPQTISALTEAEVISQLRAGGGIEVEPSLEGRTSRPDLRVDLADASVMLEIYRPSMERSLLFQTGAQFIDRAKIRDPIQEKIADQYDATAGDIDFPLFLVMNLEETPYLDFMVPEFMHGSMAFSVRLNPDLGTAEIGGLVAQPDSLGATDARMNSISGVVAYRRDLISATPGKLVGRIYQNPHAQRPLDPESLKELHRRFFDQDPPEDEAYIHTDP